MQYFEKSNLTMASCGTVNRDASLCGRQPHMLNVRFNNKDMEIV